MGRGAAYQGVLTGAALIGCGTFADTFAPLIKSNRVEYIGPAEGYLPNCRVLVMGLQNTYYEKTAVSDAVIPSGLYDSLGFLPETDLPVPIESIQFWKFWGFVSACTGYPVLWSTYDDGNITCLRKATEHTEALESGLSASALTKSITTNRRTQS